MTSAASADAGRTEAPTLGELLRRCRIARGISPERLAKEWRGRRGSSGEWHDRAIVALERGQFGVNGYVLEILAAIDALEPVSSQESDAILCAAESIPDDVRALILANPSKLDAVRALLTGGA